MQFIKYLSLIAIVGLAASTGFAQNKTFKWESDGYCKYTGTYDSAKYSEQQLRNTLRLSGELSSPHFEVNVTYLPAVAGELKAKYASLEGQSVSSLDKTYQAKVAEIKGLNIIKSIYWEKMRAKRLADIEKAYQLYKTTLLAWKDPKVIKEYRSAPACVAAYAGPLMNGGEDLLAAWKTVSEKSMEQNGSPQNIKQRFDRENASPDRLLYAQMEVMTFGWWNCANGAMYEGEDPLKDYSKEFEKIFKVVKADCEQP